MNVVGLGFFGGNIALIKYLCTLGHRVIIWERKPRQELLASWNELSPFHDAIDAQWQSLPEFKDDPAVVFLSPAVSPKQNAEWLKDDRRYSTEIELALYLAQQNDLIVHAVTGSVGKSTTAVLMGAALGIPVFGNIGRSLLDELKHLPSEIVVELSSFQLHYLRWSMVVPSSYILTPVMDHHSSWHGGIEPYRRTKFDAIERWGKTCPGVTGNDSLQLAEIWWGETKTQLMGVHNRENLLRVVAWLQQLKRTSDVARERLSDCRPLSHRLEKITDADGRHWFNDSKATSSSAVVQALKSMETKVHLILSGCWERDDVPDDLKEGLSEHTVSVALVGGAERLWAQLSMALPEVSFEKFTDLPQAVAAMKKRTGDVLLSPGAPSYDQYSNYEKRGEHFKSLALI